MSEHSNIIYNNGIKAPDKNISFDAKATNAMEGFRRKNKEDKHQELQDLDPKSSPHLEEKLIGGNVNLNLLSLFPQKEARSIGGIERSKAQERWQQWRKEELKMVAKS